ncbi:MAG: hypothetical protein H6891_01465 [Brucellaceae bacterium]|nr:hypothetical protein [Brucellaceae bacterium]
MTITHHLDEHATVVGLAIQARCPQPSRSSPPLRQNVPHCRKHLRAQACVGGAFLDAIRPVPLSARHHNLLERIGASVPRPEPARPPVDEKTGLPSPVAAALGAFAGCGGASARRGPTRSTWARTTTAGSC